MHAYNNLDNNPFDRPHIANGDAQLTSAMLAVRRKAVRLWEINSNPYLAHMSSGAVSLNRFSLSVRYGHDERPRRLCTYIYTRMIDRFSGSPCRHQDDELFSTTLIGRAYIVCRRPIVQSREPDVYSRR